MENMKRAISAFMALVLVLGMLPGVPMFAGAEEVETLPETVAEETMETVIVPEETEVPETTVIPEETVTETTAAAETLPEETVVEETIPAVTVPEETVSEETVPVETSEELNADAEAADAVIPVRVQEIQVKASTQKTFVGDKVQLSAVVSPDTATVKTVDFYIVEEDSDAIEYDEELLAEKGILRVSEAGTLVVAARAKDGENPHDSATQEDGGTVKVTFVDYSMEINKNKNAIDSDNPDGDHWYETDDFSILRLMTGEKLKLSVHYLINGVVELPLGKPNVKWYLAEGDEKYASLSVSEDTKTVTVTGKSVTSTKYITLIAKDQTLNKEDYISIAVYPVPYKVGIYHEEEEYTNKTLTVPLLASELKDKEYLELELTAQVWPLEAEEPMVWTCSDDLVIVKHPDLETDEELEEGEEPEKDTTKATLRVYPYEGKTTITISSKNFPTIKSKIIIERKSFLEAGNMDFDLATEQLSTTGKGLLSGKSFQLKAYDIQDPNNPELLTSETIKWSLSDEDEAYATISKDGKLTARTGLKTGAEITVKCAVIGNESACLELPVIIRPLATHVKITAGDLADEASEDDSSPRMASEDVINGKTIPVDTAYGRDPFELGFFVLPGDEYGARQSVTWKSSNTGIAAIDPDTDEIIWKGKNGTVTITATAKDGSGKYGTVKLKFGAQVRNITIIKDSEDFFLRSGQSWTFGVDFEPTKPTDKSLTWSLVGENDKKYASISSAGKLTAKTVYEEHTVTVRATAKDGSGVYGETTVLIKPKKDGILTLMKVEDGSNTYVTKTTQTLSVGDSIDLEAYILGETEMEDVKWAVSSTKLASLSNKIGGSTTVTMKGTGTVTVTATSLNEPSKKTTVTLKGVRMTERVEWTHTHTNTDLACGKSLTLKAKAYAAGDKTPTISKLAWSIEGEGKQYAKVSAGKVTAIAGALTPYDMPVDIIVKAKATDGSGAYAEYQITIYPIVQSVVIENPEDVYINAPSAGNNTFVMEKPGADSISMSARVWPENAMGDVTWKTSSKTIATIDKDTGELTCKKAGTVTITATAKDGSGKKATFKLTLLPRPTSAVIEKPVYPVIAGGRSLKLTPALLDGNGNKITGKKLAWKVQPVDEMDDGTAFVTSISGGVLKTKKVTEPKVVKVTFQTLEKYKAWKSPEFEVYVYIAPEVNKVVILDEVGSPAKATKWCNFSDGGVQLYATTEAKNGDSSCPWVTWKSSNKKIAEVDKMTGEVIFHKAGTVTITATAVDGTGKTDTIKLVIRK